VTNATPTAGNLAFGRPYAKLMVQRHALFLAPSAPAAAQQWQTLSLDNMDLIPFLLVASALMGSGFVIGLHFGEARQIEARRREREFDRRLQEQLAKLRTPDVIDFGN